ncbi:helix-turn-helix domain-containing protein [Zhaonella formicivorans]|uniref:helix-turn-helix domain-containing protein n=1 Tax=Zhaonella formicivorans TaxID=2528593 RepID=UPI0010DA654B|nr:helix-turn-helix domain-containing protein [Zhaonella formicivorans]
MSLQVLHTVSEENNLPKGKKKFYSVEELLEHEIIKQLGIGRNRMYELLKKDVIHSVRIGRNYRIPLSAFEQFLKSLDELEIRSL